MASPVPTSAVQSGSRLFAAWFGAAVTARAPAAAPHVAWAFVAMAAAWALADLSRYLCYVESNWAGGRTTWLQRVRYSQFLVLYPVGAAAEAVLINAARRLAVPPGSVPDYLVLGLLGLYPVGLAVMYRHMLRQRARHLK